jgi:membrane protease YdiL (CAAX protease family)
VLAVHVALCVASNNKLESAPPRGKLRKLHAGVQAPVFWLGVYFAIVFEQLDRSLINPLYIGLGLLTGHLIFGISLLATHQDLKDTWSHFFDFGDIWNYTMRSPVVLTRFIGVAIAEEIIWRVGAQTIAIAVLGYWLHPNVATIAGIIGVATLFAIVHKHFFKNAWHVSVEFMAFSLLLGGLYWWTGSLILVMVIHAVRDIEIAYLEYLIKYEELGDKDEAIQAIEKSYMAPSRVERQ